MDIPFDFRHRPPSPWLARFVESIWYARGTVPYKSEQVAPTGSCVAIFVLGPPIQQTPHGGETVAYDRGFLVGPHDRPARNAPTGETHAVGIVSTPTGAGPCFGIQPRSVRGKVVDLEEAWPVATALRERISTTENNDPDTILEQLESTLEAGLLPPAAGLSRCEKAVAAVTADPCRPIADIARSLGISHAHLTREFNRFVGLTPRTLARILRMQRFLKQVDVRGTDWAGAAASLGWFDQAHLIRDFKRHTGVTPSQYIAAQKEMFGDIEVGQGAGFVPDPERR